MSNQTIASNLLADLSTEQQQFLVGGQQTTPTPQGQGGCSGGMGSSGQGSGGTDQDSWDQNGYDQEGGGSGGGFGGRRRRLRVRLSGYVYLR